MFTARLLAVTSLIEESVLCNHGGYWLRTVCSSALIELSWWVRSCFQHTNKYNQCDPYSNIRTTLIVGYDENFFSCHHCGAVFLVMTNNMWNSRINSEWDSSSISCYYVCFVDNFTRIKYSHYLEQLHSQWPFYKLKIKKFHKRVT